MVEGLHRLNEEKYKKGLEFGPDSAAAKITREQKQGLDTYFKTKQAEFEAALGIPKGKMPYNMLSDNESV